MNSRSVLRMLRVLLKTIRRYRHNEIQSRVVTELLLCVNNFGIGEKQGPTENNIYI
jgi:hypothetical protein